MARQRASQARDAFARVGTAPVPPASETTSNNESITASENDSINDSRIASTAASVTDITDGSGNAGGRVSTSASVPASKSTGSRAGERASRGRSRKAGKATRRVGRPRGPERHPLTIRILAETNERLTAAVEATGDSPQYIVDKALAAYLDALGIPTARAAARV